jgi:hypothetical protein
MTAVAPPAGTRRTARLARAAQLHAKLTERWAQDVALADAATRAGRESLDALPPETPEGMHVAGVQRAQRQGGYARLPYYRFRCTCHRSVEDFGPWTRDRGAAEKQRAEHMAATGNLPVEFEEV